MDLVSLFPSAPAHDLQILVGPPALKLHLLRPEDVEPLGWKSFGKPLGSMSPGVWVPTSSFLPWGHPTYDESTLHRVVLQELGCVQGITIVTHGRVVLRMM